MFTEYQLFQSIIIIYTVSRITIIKISFYFLAFSFIALATSHIPASLQKSKGYKIVLCTWYSHNLGQLLKLYN